MIYVNKNKSLTNLNELVQQSIQRSLPYMSEAFNEEQYQALILFKNRLFLEEVIEESISFNKKLSFQDTNKNLGLIANAEELIEVFTLRSTVFSSLAYDNEFKDLIEYLNFDTHDKNSAIITYRKNKELTATCRIIFDQYNTLPSDSIYSFNTQRQSHNKLAEISRNVINHTNKGLNLEFKYLMRATYNIFIDNNIELYVFAIKKEHFKLFSKFGDINVIKEISSYGSLNLPCVIVSWNPQNASAFFKKLFLK